MNNYIENNHLIFSGFINLFFGIFFVVFSNYIYKFLNAYLDYLEKRGHFKGFSSAVVTEKIIKIIGLMEIVIGLMFFIIG